MAIFFGKYTFKTTNADGHQQFLTPSSSHGETYPTVSAATAGAAERCILYQNPTEGSLVVQMADLFYFSGVDAVGWVIGAQDKASAYSIKWIDSGNGLMSLHIYIKSRSQWLPIAYAVNVLLPYLSFSLLDQKPPLAVGDLYTTFQPETITPSLAVIQATKNAQQFAVTATKLAGSSPAQGIVHTPW